MKNTNKRFDIRAVLAGALLLVVGVFIAGSAATSPAAAQVTGMSSAVTGTSSLQAQINALLALVRQLQAQLDVLRSEEPTSPPVPVATPSLTGISPASVEAGGRVTISGHGIALGAVYLRGPNDSDFWRIRMNSLLDPIIGSTRTGGNSYVFTLPKNYTVGTGGQDCSSGACVVWEPAYRDTAPGRYAIKVKVDERWSNELAFTVTAGPAITVLDWSKDGTQRFNRGERYQLRWSTNVADTTRFDIKAREILPITYPNFGSLHPYGPESIIALNVSDTIYSWLVPTGWAGNSHELRVCEAGTSFCGEWYGFTLVNSVNTIPTITSLTPNHGDESIGYVTVYGSGNSLANVDRVEFYKDGVLKGHVSVAEKKLSGVDGSVMITIRPGSFIANAEPGAYEVRAVNPQAKGGASSNPLRFTITSDESFTLSLLTNKSSYTNGETAKLTMLVANTGSEPLTVSNDGCVLHYTIIDTRTGETVYIMPPQQFCTLALSQVFPGRTGSYTAEHRFQVPTTLVAGRTYAFRVSILGRTAAARFAYKGDTLTDTVFGSLSAEVHPSTGIQSPGRNILFSGELAYAYGYGPVEDNVTISIVGDAVSRSFFGTRERGTVDGVNYRFTVPSDLKPGNYRLFVNFSLGASSPTDITIMIHEKPHAPYIETAQPSTQSPGYSVQLYGDGLERGDTVTLSTTLDFDGYHYEATAPLREISRGQFVFTVPDIYVVNCPSCRFIVEPQPEPIKSGGYYLSVSRPDPGNPGSILRSNVAKLRVDASAITVQ